jgi:hypothetical protein
MIFFQPPRLLLLDLFFAIRCRITPIVKQHVRGRCVVSPTKIQLFAPKSTKKNTAETCPSQPYNLIEKMFGAGLHFVVLCVHLRRTLIALLRTTHALLPLLLVALALSALLAAPCIAARISVASPLTLALRILSLALVALAALFIIRHILDYLLVMRGTKPYARDRGNDYAVLGSPGTLSGRIIRIKPCRR